MYVISAVHRRFGAVAVNWRSTRSAGLAAFSSETVVRCFLPLTKVSRKLGAIQIGALLMPLEWSVQPLFRVRENRNGFYFEGEETNVRSG